MIQGTLIAQCYIRDILCLHVLALLRTSSSLSTTHIPIQIVFVDCLRHVDIFEWQLQPSTDLPDLKGQLQELRANLPQDIMTRRIFSESPLISSVQGGVNFIMHMICYSSRILSQHGLFLFIATALSRC